jgi:hypothetical protein
MTIENDFAPIAALDLAPIKVKLMHEESGEGWSRAYADAIEFEYRRFLYLIKIFPGEQAAPLFDVDIFWHYHILDTMKYAADCEAVFGYFLHHFPYVGLRGDDDLAVHYQVGERMRELYESTYNEQYGNHLDAARKLTNSDVAFSLPPSPISSMGRVNKIAFSLPATKAAFSLPATQVAFSMPASTLVLPDLATGLDRSQAATFNAARPTLSRAV